MSATGRTAPPLRRTALYPFHEARHAHLVPFAGYEMPLYYQGPLVEHRAVRTGVGLFDVSHMGILRVSGASAARLVSRRTTTNAGKVRPGQCKYTFLLESSGAIVDDLLVTRLDAADGTPQDLLLVPNAATADGVFDLLRAHRRPDTEVTRHNDAASILAVQGPRSREVLEAEFGWDVSTLKFYTARWFPVPGGTDGRSGALGPILPAGFATGYWVSRTGYTGELGFELFLPSSDAVRVAEALERRGVVPCGLAARDTLRLEKGYLLSGQDFHRDRTPIEAGQQRFVELDHPFVGRETVERQVREGPTAILAGIRIDEPGAIPRHGTPVLKDGLPVGTVTSGGPSPTLEVGIALAYLPTGLAVPEATVELALRGKNLPARVVGVPFVPSARA